MPLGVSLTADIVRGEEHLRSVESEWRALEAASPTASFFSSYDFIHTTCRYFLSHSDELFIILLRADGQLVAIAPFCLSRKRRAGIPYTVVEHIGCREGYNPGVPSLLREQETWNAIYDVLQHAGHSWNAIQLSEMSAGSPEVLPWLHDPGYACFFLHDRIGYQVKLSGTFDEYLAGRSPSVRRDLRRCLRLTHERKGTPELIEYCGPDASRRGLDRYIAIERKSRKNGRGITLNENPKRLSFYRSLCESVYPPDRARVYVWRAGGDDLGATLLFVHGARVYGREIVFDESFSSLAPGVVLGAEMFRRFFNKGLDEFDMLGMHPKYGASQHKIDWATGTRDTYRFTAIPRRSRFLPWLLIQKWRGKSAAAFPYGSCVR